MVMPTTVHDILESFEQLPVSQKQEVVREILRRTIDFDFPALSDDDLVATAEEMFQQLDAMESEDDSTT
jgi:beta-glucosidase-like glycosyl hydrolase